MPTSKQQTEVGITDDELFELASTERDLKKDIETATGQEQLDEDGKGQRYERMADGDLNVIEVIQRSTGPAWNAHFKHAKSMGNSNKAASVYADSQEGIDLLDRSL